MLITRPVLHKPQTINSNSSMDTTPTKTNPKQPPPAIVTQPLKGRPLSAYYPVTPGAQPSPLSAIFLAQFNVHTGYELKWSRSQEGVSLDGVEFKALPSGLHSVERDVVTFVQPKKDSAELLYGVTVFHQNLTTSQSNDRESVKMFSLGVLVDPSRTKSALSWTPSSYTCGAEYIDQLDSMLSEWDETDGVELFDKFFESHAAPDIPQTPKNTKSKHGRSSHQHYLLKIEQLLKTMGPLVFTAWRAALLRQRILLFDAESIELSCAFSYCLSIISTIPHEVLSQLDEGREHLHYLQPLYSVGVNDIDWLSKLPQTDGFIGSSTDEILMFKTKLYDVAIKLNQDPLPKVLPSTASVPGTTDVPPLFATQRDLKRFHILAREFGLLEEDQESPLLWWCQVSESMSWRQLAWSGLYWWATAGEKDKLEDEQDSEGLCDVHDLDKEESDRALYIVGYFQSITRRIFRVLVEIMNSTDEGDVATLEFSDIVEMGLDPYSHQDAEFIVKLVKCWWDRDVKVGSSLGKLCCSGS